MRQWLDFPSDNRDRSVRRWVVHGLASSASDMCASERECRAIADRIMAGVDDRSRTMLDVIERRYDEAELNTIAAAMDRVVRGEPVQHVVGWTEFRGLRLACGPEALIPRPETEEVVGWFLEGMDEAMKGREGRGARVVDIGTGSGCMALAIKAARPSWEVWAVDQSERALALAKRNAADLGLELHWATGDALESSWGQWPGVFDGIVSNPPYIPHSEAESMATHVKEHEPGMALFVPDEQPLCFYEALISGARERLAKGGCMVAECHTDFTQKVADCWQLEGADTEVLCDLQGAERAVRLIRH